MDIRNTVRMVFSLPKLRQKLSEIPSLPIHVMARLSPWKMARSISLQQSRREIDMEKYIVEVYEDVVYWRNEKRQLHRLGGLPAVERANGYKEYYENGQLHRLGGLPAIECSDGSKFYYENGKLHRLGGLPAIEYINGDKLYYENGKYHRLGVFLP